MAEGRHAISRDRVIGNGDPVQERDFHYLSCRECKVQKDANELAVRITRLLRPEEFGKWKYQVEEILREYLRKS